MGFLYTVREALLQKMDFTVVCLGGGLGRG